MLNVVAARPAQYEPALNLLFAKHTAAERRENIAQILTAVRRGDLSLDGLLIAEIQGQPVGAILMAIQTDGTAFLWMPRTAQTADASALAHGIADALLQDASRRMDRAGVRMGQVLLDVEDIEDREVLVRNNFIHLADLAFMECSRHALPPASAEEAALEVVTFLPSVNHDRFARVLERTYSGTLDCPLLNGTRSSHEALAAHRATGRFRPELWRIYRYEQQDAGILLMAEQPERNALEIVYTGVVPEARGRGLGRAMIRHGILTAGETAATSVILAVDTGNGYAKNIYYTLGFRETGGCAVHVRLRAATTPAS